MLYDESEEAEVSRECAGAVLDDLLTLLRQHVVQELLGQQECQQRLARITQLRALMQGGPAV